MKGVIHIDNLSIGYRSKKRVYKVAESITADINGGELTCLLGANGAGKSTLLRTLSAFQPSLGGSIHIDGKELSSYSDKQLSKLISVVLTEKCDIRNMYVTDLIGMGRSPYTGFWGMLNKEDHDIIDRSIALIGIESLAHRMVHTLSDGERQKVMIAKALAQETPIILLDEPTAFLDFPSKVDMMRLLHRLTRQTGKMIFLSTHDLELALQVADKLWLMKPAGEISIGTPEDLALEGSLERFFVRDGIMFDEVSGLFRMEFECDKSVGLVGEGMRYSMMSKALRRNGIEICHGESKRGFVVKVSDAEFSLYNNGTHILSTLSIEDILLRLLPLLLKNQ